MQLQQIITQNALLIAVAMLLLWGASLWKKDASVVDPCWGLGFVLVAWSSFLAGNAESQRAMLLAAMTTAWGIRLSAYLAWRNWGKPEDYRYAEMRKRHGSRFPIVSLFTVFLFQGLIMWIVSLPLQVGITLPEPSLFPAAIGLSIFAIGLFFESLGDYQMSIFKADPNNKGQVMDQGLWHYTRHPNYFGDFLVWWGIYLTAAMPSSWWWTLVGPALMSFLLIRVSGVRLLESSLKSRVAGYEAYVRRTSSFFPLPPRDV